jgi:hypothetical protein
LSGIPVVSLLPLKVDGFGPILEKLQDREDTTGRTVLYIGIVLVLLILIPFLANRVRSRIRRRARFLRGYDQLQKLADENALEPTENRLVESMADASSEANPSVVLASLDGFDTAARAYMRRAQKSPWLEMEDAVALMAGVREKMGYRYIPEDRRPQNTRHLMLGQKLFVLARGKSGFRLLSAEILELNDLAIFTEPFRSGENIVHLKPRHAVWAFFWSPYGGECRFKTQILTEYTKPYPYLLLEHGDDLLYNEDRKIFSCDLDLAVMVTHLPAATYGRAIPSEELFDDKTLEDIPIRLIELSGSGLVVDSPTSFEEADLIQIHPGAEGPAFLEGWLAKATTVEGGLVRFRFLKKSRESLETILNFIAPRVSENALKGRKRRSAVMED